MRSRVYARICRSVAARLGDRIDFAQRCAWRAAVPSRGRLAWFHGASAGELEMLAPVLEEWVSADGHEAFLSAFSPSAEKKVESLAREIGQKHPGRLIRFGLSPCEGLWMEALESARPEVFVTARYEAWPELWMSAEKLGIRVAIVGASPRPSLRLGRAALRGLGHPLPKLQILASREADRAALSRLLPEAAISFGGDPRWDRALARGAVENERANALARACSEWPRPWLFLAQCWLSDLKAGDLIPGSIPGTLWVIPHDLGQTDSIAARLRELGWDPVRSRAAGPPVSNGCLLVDESGFLAELYRQADVAYVGGGFGAGPHSTIEPAVHGLSIACGPRRADRFPEIQEIQASGQLTLLKSPEELTGWLREEADSARRDRWKAEAQGRGGAAKRVVGELVNGFT